MGSPFKSILITGASSGLGRALARELAATGVRLALGGRDGSRLAETATTCAAKGSEVCVRQVDVTDAAEMSQWVRCEDAARPLDLVIANAGVSGEIGAPGERVGQSEWIYRVNVLGVLNTVEPLLPAMRARGRGQIGLVASLAGFRGSARGPAYAGSKAALIAQGQGWRDRLAADGVGVTVICPGYIRTPMTERHRFRLPFLLEPDVAARRIVTALASDKGVFVFPRPLPIAAWLFRLLPARVTGPLISRIEDQDLQSAN